MLKYLSGFGNHFHSEAIINSLPQGCNSPQKPPRGLYAEQISGSAFTMPRHSNQRTWVYRIQPSVMHSDFTPYQTESTKLWRSAPFTHDCPPNQLRWNPLTEPKNATDFISGLKTMAGQGNTSNLTGGAIHIYTANKSMATFFYNADAEMLIVPQKGKLLIKTELGQLELEPLEIAVIPRGIKYQVLLQENDAYGYVCENYGAPFKLPDLGPIGANSLANPRDFLTPTASFDNIKGDFSLICKFEGKLWQAKLSASPLNVVAWHGNYVPYKYDLRLFNTIGTVSYDHPDPSIFTVLTSPSSVIGMANIDFVIFPPRWMVAEDTFRPPWYHRNLMSEFMGLVTGAYDAKPNGFTPGGGSLHNRMSAHGPDTTAHTKASEKSLQPEFLGNTMAFMLESSQVWHPTEFALTCDSLQKNYMECWQDLPNMFEQHV